MMYEEFEYEAIFRENIALILLANIHYTRKKIDPSYPTFLVFFKFFVALLLIICSN
jgi:hypothetical protein